MRWFDYGLGYFRCGKGTVLREKGMEIKGIENEGDKYQSQKDRYA